MEYMPLKDRKKDIQFWLNAMSQPNITAENVALLNKCLEVELGGYLLPAVVTTEDVAKARSILEARR